VELLKDGRPARTGESARLVGTALHSFAMPFIRYELADMVTVGSEACSCGEPFATIRRVSGRILDRLTLPGGRVADPYEIVQFIEEVLHMPSWIGRFQLLQEREDSIVLLVVAAAEPRQDDMLRLSRHVRARFGPRVRFSVRVVPRLEAGGGGKFRVCRSLAGRSGKRAL